MERAPDSELLTVLGDAVHEVRRWSDEVDPGSEVALNTILTNGRETVGTRVGRSLWYVERDLVHPCEACDGALHVEAGMTSPYRAVVVASERITTTEDWTAVPKESLFRVDSELGLSFTAV